MLKPGDIHGRKILLGCLDWGHGHVSRSIPLIHQLTGQGNELIIWCSASQQDVFRQFDLKVTYYTGFKSDFNFRGDGNFFLEMIRNSITFSRNIWRERQSVRNFIADNEIDLIISDHRYGLYASEIDSVFVTHQVDLPEKSGFIARKIHRKWMKKFTCIWIMDDFHDRSSGDLSEKIENSDYIGHYSRFSLREIPVEKTLKYVAVISGPKAYAKQFYNEVIALADKDPENWTIICSESIAEKSSSVVHFHDWKSGDNAIASAETIISRCGYSTLMDLKFLKAKAILSPTPGQLEQEYLSEYHQAKKKGLWDFVDDVSGLKILNAGSE